MNILDGQEISEGDNYGRIETFFSKTDYQKICEIAKKQKKTKAGVIRAIIKIYLQNRGEK